MESLERRAYLTVDAAAAPSDDFLDPHFGTGGKVFTPILGDTMDVATAVAVQPDGKVLMLGWTAAEQTTRVLDGLLLARFNQDGSLDSTFGPSRDGQAILETDRSGTTPFQPDGLAVRPDGKIVVATETFKGFLFARFNPDGTVDRSFGPRKTGRAEVAIGGHAIELNALVIRPDGRIVAGGSRHTDIRMSTKPGDDFVMVQLTAAGRLDGSFGPNGYALLDVSDGGDDFIDAMALAPDGSIIVAGRSMSHHAVARVRPDGTLDPTFGPRANGVARMLFGGRTPPNATDTLTAVALQRDGRIALAGSARGDFVVARLTASGRLDKSFGPSKRGWFATDLRSPDDYAAELFVQPDEKLVVVGTTGPWDGDSHFVALRYGADGVSLDKTYGNDGIATADFGPGADRALAAARYPGGRIVLAGGRPNLPDLDAKLARLNDDGSLDDSFSEDGRITLNRVSPAPFNVYDTLRQPDGKILVLGDTSNSSGLGYSFVRRYRASGGLDTSFGRKGVAIVPGSRPTFEGRLAADSTGQITAALQVNEGDLMNPHMRLYFVRFREDGQPDAGFGEGGVLRSEPGLSEAQAMAVDSLGRLLLAGDAGTPGWYVARFTQQGALDKTFGTAGTGMVHTRFDGFETATPRDLRLLNKGKIVVGGSALDFGITRGGSAFAAARYTADGTLDSTFGIGGKVIVTFPAADGQSTYDHADSMTLLPDGSIVLAGYSTTGQDSRLAVAKLTSAGTPDPSFASGGRFLHNPHVDDETPGSFSLDDAIRDIVALPDGRLVALVWLQSEEVDGAFPIQPQLMRLTSRGGIDTTYGNGGTIDVNLPTGDRVPALHLLVQEDAKVITVGAGDDGIVLARFLGPSGSVVVRQVGHEMIFTGTQGNDVIRFTRGPRGEVLLDDGTPLPFSQTTIERFVIRGLGGDDLIDASALARSGVNFSVAHMSLLVEGGSGDDFIVGGWMADTLHGGQGNDTILGDVGHDTIFAHRGNDLVDGGLGNDYLNGGPDADTVRGDAGNDQIFAVDNARDTIDGGFFGFDRHRSDDDDLLTNLEGILG